MKSMIVVQIKSYCILSHITQTKKWKNVLKWWGSWLYACLFFLLFVELKLGERVICRGKLYA